MVTHRYIKGTIFKKELHLGLAGHFCGQIGEFNPSVAIP